MPQVAAPKKSARQLEWDRQFAVNEEIDALLSGSDPNAGAKLVNLLHGPNGQRAFKRMSNGIDTPRGIVGAYKSFAEMCHHFNRVDILRAVYEAGPPQWLKDIVPLTAQPLKTDPTKLESKDKLNRRQFSKLGFRLPKLGAEGDWLSAGGWLNALCVRQFALNHLPVHRSVFSIATDVIDDRTRPFLELHLDTLSKKTKLDGEVFDLNFTLLKPNEMAEVQAIIRELQMRRTVDAAASAAPTLEPATSESPRRTTRRAGL